MRNEASSPDPITGSCGSAAATPANADANVAELVGVITNAAGGLVEFPLSAPDANLTPKTYYYDMQMTDSGGKVRTVCAGMWIVKQDVSK